MHVLAVACGAQVPDFILRGSELAKMSSHSITRVEAQEAYDIATLKREESGLARCYLQLFEAARRVSTFDWPGCDSAASSAMDALRQVVSFTGKSIRNPECSSRKAVGS